MSRIAVYENNPREYGFYDNPIVARVQYNKILDYYDGSNFTNGGMGMHKGLTKLRNGKYVIIIGSQWQGNKDYAYCVDKKEALQEALQAELNDYYNPKRKV